MERSWEWAAFVFYGGAIFILFIAVFSYSSHASPTDNFSDNKENGSVNYAQVKDYEIEYYENILRNRIFAEEQINSMSVLGKWLLAPKGTPPPSYDHTVNYMILTWDFRHFRDLPENVTVEEIANNVIYSSVESWKDGCPVQNCKVTFNRKHMKRANAVLFPLRYMTPSIMPKRIRKNQRWIFLTDESMLNISSVNNGVKISDFNGIFNWSMSYRMDSDVPVPYGRAISFSSKIEKPSWKLALRYKLRIFKSKMLAVLDNCEYSKKDRNYIMKLKKYFGKDMDIIGKCDESNSHICSARKDCPFLKFYKFYLSFEKYDCSEFFTEKTFLNAYKKYAVPIIKGPSFFDCVRLLPPNSFLHVDEFKTPLALYNHIKYMDEIYETLHQWRLFYKVIIDYDFNKRISNYYCRICEALNFNDRGQKVYETLGNFWNLTTDCKNNAVNKSHRNKVINYVKFDTSTC